jgi:hypothetical protein
MAAQALGDLVHMGDKGRSLCKPSIVDWRGFSITIILQIINNDFFFFIFFGIRFTFVILLLLLLFCLKVEVDIALDMFEMVLGDHDCRMDRPNAFSSGSKVVIFGWKLYESHVMYRRDKVQWVAFGNGPTLLRCQATCSVLSRKTQNM